MFSSLLKLMSGRSSFALWPFFLFSLVCLSSHCSHPCRCLPAGLPHLRHLHNSTHLQLIPMISTAHTLQYFSAVWHFTHSQFQLYSCQLIIFFVCFFFWLGLLFCFVLSSQNVSHSNHTDTASKLCFSVFSGLVLLVSCSSLWHSGFLILFTFYSLFI